MKKIIKLFTLCLLFVASTSLFAQIPNGYYNNAQGKTGDALKTALHNIIKGHHVVSYSGLLDAYAYTDCYSDGKIWDIYSNKHWSLTQDCGSYDSEGDCWNREHTWPQSWFNEQSTPRSDLFHVMPTDGYVNNRRSNYPYGEVSNPTWTSGNGSKLGKCTTAGYSGTVFEPVDDYKGDIARNFFYMSVRYYSEDSNWGTSDMTNKSTILDWAMTMLLRWSDEDPVSQKEIDRNNAVYGYQNNRNPFIDHPEYARMIWDPNWTGGETYNITCATGLSHGSISAPATAEKGSTVAITATPDPGYMVNSYTVYKTGSPSTTVTVSSNGTFTMPDYDVTVTATFVANNTYYTITTASVTHGSISVSTNSAKSGTTITMTATPETGYSLYSWYVYKTGDMNTSVYTGTNGSFVMPAFNVTVNATFSTQGSSVNGDYVKVTESLSDWSGEYLIVYEDGNLAFNGGLTTLDANSNVIGVTISNNTIAANQNTTAAKFTIAKSGNDYTIKSASGYYIGATSNTNVVNSSTSTAYTNTISYNNGDIDIVGSGGAYLRYNTNNARFRYYKTSSYTSQKAIQLYKRAVTVITPTHTIQFNSNGGTTGSMNDQTVEEYVPTALTPNAFTREGFEFDGWNTEANGTGTYYADNANITLIDDVTLYAQWNPKYNIILDEVVNGSISANHSSAVEGTTITLTAAPATGYELEAWTVTDGSNNSIEVVENQFEMPADHVTVSATFTLQSSSADAYYVKVTSDPTDWSGEYLIVCETNNVAFNGTIENNWGRCSAVTITSDHTIESNETTDAYKVTISGSSTAGYQFQFPNGKYMNWKQAKAFTQGNTAENYTISISNGDVSIAFSTVATLKYNYNGGTGGLRSYASGQTAIQLYKKIGGETPVPTYTITFYPNGGTGNVYTQTVNENEATALTANAFTREGFVFNGWNTLSDGTGTAYTDQQPVTLNANLDLYAQWTSQGGGETNEYNYYLVTSADQLISGRTYLIVNLSAAKALGATQNNNNRSASSVTIANDVIEGIENTVCELTLGGETDAWTLYDTGNNGYLYAAGGGNYLRTQSTLDDKGRWTISFTDGETSIVSNGLTERNNLRYNSNNNLFSCYTSGQQPVVLFIRGEEYNHTTNETVANLFEFDKHTVRNGATLTVTGTAVCNDPDQLIIEDGAQFIHHNEGVKATVTKSITAFTDSETSDGWYTIAMPMTSVNPAQVEGMTDNDYDLYAYDEDAALEWINYKNNNGFNLISGQGYLYAHNPGTTLEIKGTLNNGDLSQTVTMSYGNTDPDIQGFNLLGNPTAHEINFTKTESVSDGYYYLNNDDLWTYEVNNTVPAGRGFLVKANAEGQSVTINPQTKRGNDNLEMMSTSYLQIDVDGEKTYVKLTEGVSMPLISLNGRLSSLYFTQDEKNYVMLVRDNAQSLELNYEVNSRGTHTLKMQGDTEHLSYLHLIDRLTGADIDLLAQPTYRFESNAGDLSARFCLRFSPAENGQNNETPFAYLKDGKIIVTSTDADAQLQIIDVSGRIIAIHRGNLQSVPTEGMTNGVYLLRLISNAQVKTQKIVLR